MTATTISVCLFVPLSSLCDLIPMTDTQAPTASAASWPESLRVKIGFAEMLKGGVIMDVCTVEQARIAQAAGACAVMALERVPAQIRAQGGVARMANPRLIEAIMQAVTIPVMAKARIGHLAEAQVLAHLGVDFIDESEVLTPADAVHHIDKRAFDVPFVCGARNLGEALRRINEGAALIRTKGEAGTGDVVHAVKHMRQLMAEIRALAASRDDELYVAARDHRVPYELVRWVATHGALPVPNFSAGGIATPADAALMRQLGADAVFVGSGIFMDSASQLASLDDAQERAQAIVRACTHFDSPAIVAECSAQCQGALHGLAVHSLPEHALLQTRGD